MMKNRKNKQAMIRIYTAGIAVLCIILIGVVYLFAREKKETAEPVIEIETAEAEIESETESESETETNTEEETLVAADIASMNDTQDPQEGQSEKGADADLGQAVLKAGEGENEAVTLGIDVAKYQDVIDWNTVREAGVEFAMIRIGYRTSATGIIYEDPLAKYNMQEAQAAGIKLGVYFFSTAVTKEEAAEETAFVTQYIAPYKITYPVVYNCENFTSENSRQYGMSVADRTTLAETFLDEVKKQGYTPMFYASRNEMEGSALWDMNRLEPKYKVWVSQYPGKPYPETKQSSYTGKYDMWQYTNQGTVPGIAKKVDLNIAYFGYDKEAEAKSGEPAEIVEADPEVNIQFTEVNETVTAKSVTNLRTVPSSANSETIAGQLINPDTAVRTGIGNNGWSRVLYNGQKYYAVSSYLTTDLTATETPSVPAEEPKQDGIYRAVNETVTAKSDTNLRTAPDKNDSSNIAGILHYGVQVTRTGIGSNGWSKLMVDGQELYAVSGYLTTKLNYQETSKPTAENPDGNAIYTQAGDMVTAKSVTNLRTLPSTESDDTIAAVLHNGEVVTRIATGSQGWSKVDYNGQTLYAITSYLAVVQ